MIKKFISIFLAFIFLFSALPSCNEAVGNDSTPETILPVPETSKGTSEPLILNSFSAIEVAFHNDPYGDYLCFMPEKGSEESERWGRIYAIGSISKELIPRINEGEYATITYSGEIEPLQDSEYGFINNIHSVTIKTDPHEYGSKNYSVAIMRHYVALKENEFITESGGAALGRLIVSSHNEFNQLMQERFLHPSSIPDDATDYQAMSISRFNNRIHLVSNYDEEFFSDYDLLMVFKRTGSGGSRFDVTDISVESGICTVTIDFTKRGVTCDVGQWIALISIPKEVSAGVTEYKTRSNVSELDAPLW